MIVVGMSGGVDSSVAALLLKQKGETVQGVFMKNWEDSECRADNDRADALRVCATLDIPFATRNFADVYWKEVFQEFLDGYKRGLTPNPDILCNREVKFKVFLNEALAMGADRLATGHYAHKGKIGNEFVLLRGRDPGKDQSYFLHAISQDALALAEFPVGELPKADVRALAEQANLVTARKKDSTGICFIGERNFKDFLSSYIPATAGDMVTEKGDVVGRHEGALYYTVGQRAPLGGVKGYPGETWFVLHKDVPNNRLIVGQGRNHPALITQDLTTDVVSWIAGHAPADSFDATVQIRHLGEALPAHIVINEDGQALVRFKDPIWGVAPGQSAVFYNGDVCLGGAPILPSTF